MIPLIRPRLPDADEITDWLHGAYVSGTWSNFGPIHEHCIEQIKKWTGGYPVLFSNATAALEALALTIDPKKFVLIPDYTHAGSVVPFTRHNHPINIMACDEKTRAMDLNALEYILRGDEMTGTAIIVNPFGRGIDRRSYTAMAQRHGVKLIYDYAGAWGDFRDLDDGFPTVYSFHATKSMPIGEGGVAIMPTREGAENLRRLSNFGTMPNRMILGQAGTNSKLSEVSAAVLAAQLEQPQIDRIWKRITNRRHLQRIYSEAVGHDLKPTDTLNMNLSMCTIALPEGIHPKKFEWECGRFGFTSLQYYIPLRTMPAFQHACYIGNPCLSLDRCVGLPSDVTIDQAMIIAEDIRDIIAGLSQSTLI